MVWQKVKINSFLTERKDRFKPDIANELGLKRIHKIDFLGNIHILEKLTNTGMILVKNGDLVISGINVEKGALAVYEGQEDVLATIHYSSYKYNKNKIDVDYLKWFLKSNLFKTILLKQVGGGIKTELKPKRFLPLEINLPDLKAQIEIKNKILAVEKEIEEIKNKIGKENFYLTKLKESILQEAVQGKLIEQNSNDEPASILLEKIKKEKEQLIKEKKIKKEKLLPEITQDEILYELPTGWEWVRLGDIYSSTSGGTPNRNELSFWKNGTIPWLKSGELNDNLKINNCTEYITELGLKKSSATLFKKGILLIALYGATAGKLGILDFESTTNQAVCGITNNGFNEIMYLYYFLLSNRSQILNDGAGGAQPNISQTYLKNKLFPLPPLSEQKRIVKKVDKLMAYCDDLEQEINNSKKQAEQLMQSVLKEAFEQK